MRSRKTLLTCACLLAAAAAAFASAAADRPNFTGTWELDQTRSHSIPPNMKQTMTVVQEGDRVSFETKITDANGERTVKDAYTLDGKEAEFTPQRPPNAPPDAPAPKGKRAGRWMANDRGFIVEEEIINQTPQGPETVLVARKWMTWPDGTLSIEVITERGGNAFNNKRVFVKKS
ncbi:MAG TPA: hypothetical protein VG148_17695 [Pyrinomonadaceae bacterium]|nr:hypothetical protein [Pyrinomonadaceae bacterium]